MTLNGTLSTKKQAAIAALLTSPSITEAAEASGIGRSTMHRWLEDPEFKQALSAAEADAISSAVRRMIGDMSDNLSTMRDIRVSEDSSPALKLRAAALLDASLLRWREAATLEERLVAIEARLTSEGR